MKKLFTLIAIITLAFASHSQTTQEEYNYITKGYKMQLDGGLDMKKGYTFDDVGEYYITSGEVRRTCTFKALYRSNELKPCAIMLIYKRSDNNFLDFLCIPTGSDAVIWNQYFDKVKTYTGDGAVALMWGLAKLSSKNLSK